MTLSAAAESKPSPSRKMQRRACVLELGKQAVAIASDYARQIVDVERLSWVPSRSEEFLGLFSVRGQIVPLINIAPLLKLESPTTQRALLIHSDEADVAFSVNAVTDFVHLPALQQLEADSPMKRFSLGRFDYAAQQVVLLDVPKLLTAFEQSLGC